MCCSAEYPVRFSEFLNAEKRPTVETAAGLVGAFWWWNRLRSGMDALHRAHPGIHPAVRGPKRESWMSGALLAAYSLGLALPSWRRAFLDDEAPFGLVQAGGERSASCRASFDLIGWAWRWARLRP